jgi:hypothetical protein
MRGFFLAVKKGMIVQATSSRFGLGALDEQINDLKLHTELVTGAKQGAAASRSAAADKPKTAETFFRAV